MMLQSGAGVVGDSLPSQQVRSPTLDSQEHKVADDGTTKAETDGMFSALNSDGGGSTHLDMMGSGVGMSRTGGTGLVESLQHPQHQQQLEGQPGQQGDDQGVLGNAAAMAAARLRLQQLANLQAQHRFDNEPSQFRGV